MTTVMTVGVRTRATHVEFKMDIAMATAKVSTKDGKTTLVILM